jgi:hypothetical protein
MSNNKLPPRFTYFFISLRIYRVLVPFNFYFVSKFTAETSGRRDGGQIKIGLKQRNLVSSREINYYL